MKNVEIKDLGLNALKRKLRELNGKEITVGFHEEAGMHKSGKATYAEIGFWLEFGKTNRNGTKSPERPALRNAYYDSRKMLDNRIANNIHEIMKGDSVINQLKKTGKWYAEIHRGSVHKFSTPGNAASTIRQKGFDDPWIWGYSTVNAIDYKVK